MITFPSLKVCMNDLGANPYPDTGVDEFGDVIYEKSTAEGGARYFDAREYAKDKKPSQLYYCETTENALLLADAGYGVALLPDIRLPAYQHLTKRTLCNNDIYSFGLYYKSYRNKPYLRDFIRILHGDESTFQT